ncbi:MAG: RtcB family protein [Desulfuromonadaceae bacterium]|nr:RtcB family protein [Desulfuromonadaceae bacterium]
MTEISTLPGELMFETKKSQCQLQIHAKELDPVADEQLHLIVNHPALQGLIAIMPDAHAGAGCVIGFTGKFRNAVIPNIVGVDIGCGVASHPLPGLRNIDFGSLDRHIRANIPLGMNSRDSLALFDHPEVPQNLRRAFTSLCEHIEDGFYRGNRIGKHISPLKQIGTLGGGNHFIEIGRDERGGFHLIIHSGSRNLGKRVAEFYQEKASRIVKEMGMKLPKGQEFLPMEAGGGEYVKWAAAAQAFARYNRRMMLIYILTFFGIRFDERLVIESVHNYISETDHFIRKGAISAHKGERVIIPLNMADGTILGVGKGNSAYNLSAPHGAGRRHGRREMFRKLQSGEYSLNDFRESMRHVFSTSVIKETFDESKFAYKPLADIEEYLLETVEVTERLTPVYNLKATGE